MKKRRRAWKIKLIEECDPEWEDVYEGLSIGMKWIPACAGMTDKSLKSLGKFWLYTVESASGIHYDRGRVRELRDMRDSRSDTRHRCLWT